MLTIRPEQLSAIGDRRLAEKMDDAFRRSLPGFADWPPDRRMAFIGDGIDYARSLGFASEIGIVSYAMAVWWLDFGFEEQSPALLEALASGLPEIRRVHMMNEWVAARLLHPDDPEAADRALADSITLTEPWGAA